jgi:hypothetical protein
MAHPRVIDAVKREISGELVERETRQAQPQIGHDKSNNLEKELREWHDVYIARGWDMAEQSRVAEIEAELLTRGHKQCEKEYMEMCAKDRKQKQLAYDELMKDINLELDACNEDERSGVIGRTEAVWVRKTLSSQRNKITQEWRDKMEVKPSNTCVNKAVSMIHHRNHATSQELKTRAAIMHNRWAQNQLRENNAMEQEADLIPIHMLTAAEKAELRNKARQQSQDIEYVTQQRAELMQRKNAQEQNIKLQESRAEQLKRAKRATLARMEKMKTLEDECDCLISQHFLEPVTGQMFEIIDVRMDRVTVQSATSSRSKVELRMMAVTRPIDSIERGADLRDHGAVKVFAIDEAKELVNQFAVGKRNFEDTPMPQSDTGGRED